MWRESHDHARRSMLSIRCSISETGADLSPPAPLDFIGDSRMILASEPQTAPAFILGLGPNGYGHARSLARAGVPALGFYYSRRHFGRSSRLLHAYPVARSLSAEALASVLIETAASFRSRPVLFAASDEFAFLVAQAREHLLERFAF